MSRPEIADEVLAFFEEHEVPQGALTLSQILERLRINVALRERESERLAAALAEYRVGLAVPTKLDRAHLGKSAAQVPDPAAPEEVTARQRLALKAARLCWQLGRKTAAEGFLDRVIAAAPDSDLADQARELRSKWKL